MRVPGSGPARRKKEGWRSRHEFTTHDPGMQRCLPPEFSGTSRARAPSKSRSTLGAHWQPRAQRLSIPVPWFDGTSILGYPRAGSVFCRVTVLLLSAVWLFMLSVMWVVGTSVYGAAFCCLIFLAPPPLLTQQGSSSLQRSCCMHHEKGCSACQNLYLGTA